MRSAPSKRLFWRTCAVMLGILALAVLVPALVTIGYEDRLFRETLRDRAVATADTAALVASDALAAGDSDALGRFVIMLVHNNPDVISALVADRAGRVIAHSSPQLEGTTIPGLKGPSIATTVLDSAADRGESVLRVHAPVKVSGEPWGTLRIDVPLSPIEKEMRGAMKRVLLLGGLLLLLGAIGAAWLAHSVAQPVGQLAALAQEVARGNLGVRARIRSRDEIERLAESFNAMVESLLLSRQEIERHKAELEKKVEERTAQLRRAIDDLHSAQRQLVQVEKLSALGQLVSGVAHELNNPLASVIGYADLLAQWLETPGPVRQRLEVIRREAERCRRIVQDLLIFSRRRTIRPQPLDLNRLVRETVETQTSKIGKVGVGIDLLLDPCSPVVRGDSHMLQQVLINLIGNALDALEGCGRAGRITISTRSATDGVRVVVADNGPGIPDEIMDRIFEPFFTTKEIGQGTGLGLSLCYGIIQEHKGRVEACNNPEGGVSFTISLPSLDATGPGRVLPEVLAGSRRPQPSAIVSSQAGEGGSAPVEEARAGPSPKPLNVLVVDDEPDIANLIEDVLALSGHRVTKAASGERALEQLVSKRFDLVLSDMRMPDLDGPGLHARIRASWPEMLGRIVFITGDAASAETLEFFTRTGARTLAKPFTIGELQQILAAACSTHSSPN